MNIKEKAAKLLGYEISKIKRVKVWTDRGTCSVMLKNGMPITIPYEVWTLGWTEEQYIEFRLRAKKRF